MFSIKIIGAGSIGNHLAHASRTRGWQVLLTDIDKGALERSKFDIYPSRYGAWDPEIITSGSNEAKSESADVVFIGTPPDSHLKLALETLEHITPKVILIEKPLAGPDLKDCQTLLDACRKRGVFAAVGYNHCLGANTKLAEEVLSSGALGPISTISARTREHWSGIFAAHPWLPGPEASYLGYSSRGGGACCEHSHGINIWQHFANFIGAGRVEQVTALLDMVEEGQAKYDRSAFLNLKTSEGLVGDVIQDVVTFPHDKSVRIQGSEKFLEWRVNYKPGTDAVFHGDANSPIQEHLIKKTRPDDFIAEIDHLASIMNGEIKNSPISLERGLDTLMVIAAAFKSHHEGRAVKINWAQGYCPNALQ